MRPHPRKHASRQRGQSAVFVVVTLSVVLLALVFLYRAGIVTGEKQRLQNAADATAYSVSLLEARDLNFAAYTNRAMVANEVAIGQLVGLVSFAHYWRSYGAYLRAYDFSILRPLTLSPPLPPVTTPIIEPMTRFAFDIPGNLMVNGLNTVARLGSRLLHAWNKGYAIAQQVYHWSTIAYAGALINDIIPRNAPGARLSDFGWLSLIAHTATYGMLPDLPGQFIKTYRSKSPGEGSSSSGEPDDAENEEGMQRFAAVVRASRDEFTAGRGWTLPITIPPILPLDLDVNLEMPIDLGLFRITFFIHIELHFGIDAERLGGSELVYTGDNAAGKRFGWSAADTMGISVDFFFLLEAGLDFEICLPIVGCFGGTIGPLGASVDIGDGSAEVILTIGSPFNIDFPLIPEIPFPTAAPFASGSAQVGKTALGNYRNNTAEIATTDVDRYGGAPQISPAWSLGLPPVMIPSPLDTSPAPAVPVVSLTLPTLLHKLNSTNTYGGLPDYIDTVDNPDPWGFQAPFLLVGVIKDTEDIGTGTGPEPVGRFAVDDRAADEELGAIAKSEVYFKRPTDFALFARADGQEEYGSAFNPYWSARLVDTTHAERVVSLWLQQDQAFGTVADTLNLDEWNPLDWITP